MATSAFLSICCIANETDTDESTEAGRKLIGHVITIVSIVFCTLSLVSVLYLTWPRAEAAREIFRSTSRILVGPNLNSIIKCLISVDILAVIGLFIRSCVWASQKFPDREAHSMDFPHIFCVVSSLWVEFFFMCNHFWHMIYGMEAFMVANNREISGFMKFLVGWIVPAIATAGGSLVIYHPGFHKCYHTTLLVRSMSYLIYLGPILMVFIFNPLIFYQAAKSAKKALIWHYGRYTSSERKLVDAIHVKFILIMTAYVCCWLPNLVSAILQLTNSGRDAKLAVWVLMAVLNPLQAVLGVLVFWGLPSNNVFRRNIFSSNDSCNESSVSVINRSSRSGRSTASESEPLISFKRRDYSSK
ncbi:hypothetical protein FSP39_019308 [Pinctada imbricata]|uniref:G-protein coupled receptors family 2 profile 2 domain-containing protein n=1 Tax=Pinctada imbricata TaxID=66713 RepID=A0AA89BJM4_PINIB|nr:hypothetical protein FSP39_019308 [Pinctada imbricata]